MPRKPPLLSTEDLRAIIAADWMPSLTEWAKGELQRRERAGKLGGRPKAARKPTKTATASKT
jgi:hypothetical protein